MEARDLSGREDFRAADGGGARPLAGAADHGGAEGARRAPPGCGTCSCPRANTAPGLTNLEYAPLVRDHGALADRAGGVQLLGPRYRQYGNAGALRDEGAAGAVAEAAAGRRNPLRLRDDRAGRGLVRRDQYRGPHPARGQQQLRHQRPQMVDLGRDGPALQDLHPDGQDRPGRAAASAAIDDPGAARHAGRHGAAAADRVRL